MLFPKEFAMDSESPLTRYLRNSSVPVFTFFAITVAFTTYFCMYAFRKPFSAGQFQGMTLGDSGVGLKTAFVISQIVGYALSKVIGIRVCSEISRQGRAWALVALVAIAQFALLMFAVLPPQGKVVAMFFNGLPLGMIWGLVVLYLEGRRTSELLLAGLSCSYIVSSGVVKSVGLGVMKHFSLTEFWMPFATGLLFLPLFLLSVWLLNQIPQPDVLDVQRRVQRAQMTRSDRWSFFRLFAPGLMMLLITYFFLTAYRDFRDNFAPEVFEQLGYGSQQIDVFARSETQVAFGVMAALAALNMIKSNRWGLIGAFTVMGTGTAMLALGTWLLDANRISGLTWMIMTGTGAYLAYVPYGSVLFDRLIASTRTVGTAVFAINLADSVGYGGTIMIMLFKDLSMPEVERLDFLRYLSYFMAALGTLLLITSCSYFLIAHRHHD
jgi:hypothetical protein